MPSYIGTSSPEKNNVPHPVPGSWMIQKEKKSKLMIVLGYVFLFILAGIAWKGLYLMWELIVIWSQQ